MTAAPETATTPVPAVPPATAPGVPAAGPTPPEVEDGLDALLFDLRVLDALLFEPTRPPRLVGPA